MSRYSIYRCPHRVLEALAGSDVSCVECRREAKHAGKRGLALDGLMIEETSSSTDSNEGARTMATTKKTTARKPAAKKATPAKKTKRTPKTVEHGARTRRKNRSTGSTIAVYNLEDAAAKPVGKDGKRLDVKADDSGKNWLAVCETHGTAKRFASWTDAALAYDDGFVVCAGCRKALADAG